MTSRDDLTAALTAAAAAGDAMERERAALERERATQVAALEATIADLREQLAATTPPIPEPPDPEPPTPPTPPLSAVFGPDGSHWPDHTPRSGHAHVIDVTCSWTAIRDALRAVTDTQAAEGVLIRVAPGQLAAGSFLSGSTPVLSSVGSAAWRRRVLVAPRDGYGTVRMDSGKLEAVDGVTIARFISSGRVTIRNSRNFSLVQCRLDLGFNVYADTRDSSGIGLYEVVVPVSAATEQDPCQYRAGAGYSMLDTELAGCYLAPQFRPVSSSAHLDTFQMFGGGNYRALTIRDSVLFGSNNCALQVGGGAALGTPFVTLEHSLLVAQRYAVARYPVPAGAAGGGSQAINGAGEPGQFYATDSLLVGTLHATRWARVTDTRALPGTTNAVASGAWGAIDPATITAAWLADRAPEPTDDRLARLWA